jgi:hypothetical protein
VVNQLVLPMSSLPQTTTLKEQRSHITMLNWMVRKSHYYYYYQHYTYLLFLSPGRPMRISSASITQAVQNSNQGGNRRNVNNNNNNNGGGNRRFGGRGGNNNNNRRSNNQRAQPNSRDLDAEMDSYMANTEDVQMN